MTNLAPNGEAPGRQQSIPGRGSLRGGGFGSGHLARRDTEAREKKLPVFRVPPMPRARYHVRSESAYPRHNIPRLVEASHMRAAGGKKAVYWHPTRLLLQRTEQYCPGYLKSP